MKLSRFLGAVLSAGLLAGITLGSLLRDPMLRVTHHGLFWLEAHPEAKTDGGLTLKSQSSRLRA